MRIRAIQAIQSSVSAEPVYCTATFSHAYYAVRVRGILVGWGRKVAFTPNRVWVTSCLTRTKSVIMTVVFTFH